MVLKARGFRFACADGPRFACQGLTMSTSCQSSKLCWWSLVAAPRPVGPEPTIRTPTCHPARGRGSGTGQAEGSGQNAGCEVRGAMPIMRCRWAGRGGQRRLTRRWGRGALTFFADISALVQRPDAFSGAGPESNGRRKIEGVCRPERVLGKMVAKNGARKNGARTLGAGDVAERRRRAV